MREWLEDKVIFEINFDATTFHIQIHGLPLIFLHEGTTESIGNQIDFLHIETINQRCVIGQRYLRIKVDIAVEEPIPADFFQKREEWEDYWVYFEYERL